MTDVQYSPETEVRTRASTDFVVEDRPGGSVSIMVNLAGALTSLALIAGIGVWGYKLLVRDVSGIPIVRAAEGDMRVLPDDPGGKLAQHQGLAVNAIAAEGRASGPVDQVKLATAPVTLEPGDALAPITQPAPLGSAETFIAQASDRADVPQAATPASLAASEIDAVVTELVADASTLSDTAPTETAAAAEPNSDVRVHRVALDAPGPRESLRPQLRPARGALVHQASFAPAPKSAAEIDASAIPSGTRLAQLGAFDTAEDARAEWTRLEQRFGAVLANKSRVIQEVDGSGRTFYRLRAMGFRGLDDARRFCSAFKAEGVDCIPVASR
ncbi:MAG: SPOR domain-containing protein [Roseobacter sp.]